MKPYRGIQINRSHPHAKGLIASYVMNEGEGSGVFDSSGNNNTGTLINMDPATDWVAGQGGFALDFDGANDYIEVPHSGAYDNLPQITIEAKVKLNVLPSIRGEAATLGILRNTSSPWFSARMRVESTDALTFSVNAASGFQTASISPASVGVWYHVIGTYNGSNVKLYLDSVLYSTSPSLTGEVLNAGGSVRLGANDAASLRLEGKIGFVNIWKRALSAGEIVQRTLNPYAMFESGIPAGILGILGVYPARIHINDLMNPAKYPRMNMIFNVGGSDMMWFHNNLVLTSTGVITYVLRDNVMILQ